MAIQVKRIYEKRARTDGSRILADRLWPRGIAKVDAHITYWAKDLTPSNELRSWFHEDRENRFKEFEKKYRAELKVHKKDIQSDMKKYGHSYTILTAAKDIEHSHIPTLLAFLQKI